MSCHKHPWEYSPSGVCGSCTRAADIATAQARELERSVKSADMASKGKPRGNWGTIYPFGPNATALLRKGAKLTEAQAGEIRSALKSGATNRALSVQYGIHINTVRRIAKGDLWRGV